MESLEDRTVLSTLSTITSNFNGTAIPAGDYVWFSSVAKVQGVTSSPVTLHVANQKITFTSNGTPYSLSVPDTNLTLTPGATSAATAFDSGANAWNTSAPSPFSGNVFLGGVAFQATAGLPGGIKNVSWQGEFTTDTGGIKVNWQWAAAVYSQFSTNHAALGVKPVDDNHLSQYQNSDHAGTPEAYKGFVLGGARGGGGSNYTGSYSSTALVIPEAVTVAPPASISGYVYVDANANGVMDAGDWGIQGVVVALTGTDDLGNAVNLTTQTDATGLYSFSGLRAGTYTVFRPVVLGYMAGASSVGTVDGINPDGLQLNGDLAQILLKAGDNGVNYNFGELLAGS